MLYQYLNFPNAENGFYNLDQSITVITDPGTDSYYFWSCEFSIMNGDGAYMGLQTDVLAQENLGKGVNVAMWGATNAEAIGPDAGVRTNTDGEKGMGLYMPYLWQQGVTYRLRVWQNGSDDNGFWWAFWILDESANIDTHIGNIYVPLRNYIASNTILWTEYYGDGKEGPCDSPVRKPESVEFLNPCMDNDGNNPGTQVLPESTSFNTPACPNYSIMSGDSPFSCIQSVNIGG